jgi:hypothetical protein
VVPHHLGGRITLALTALTVIVAPLAAIAFILSAVFLPYSLTGVVPDKSAAANMIQPAADWTLIDVQPADPASEGMGIPSYIKKWDAGNETITVNDLKAMFENSGLKGNPTCGEDGSWCSMETNAVIGTVNVYIKVSHYTKEHNYITVSAHGI